MARRGQSLMELARLGNVGGDIRLGQWHEKKRKEAERALSSLTDKAKKAASGDYKGEKWLEAGKFISNFIPVYGKAINMALSGIDILADKAKAKKGVREFKRLSPQSKGPYGDYLSQNFNALLSQVEQTQKASAKQSLLSNLMSMGMKSGITDKLDTVGKETLGRMFPQMGLQDIKMPKLSGKSSGWVNALSKGDKSNPGIKELYGGLQDKFKNIDPGGFGLDPKTIKFLKKGEIDPGGFGLDPETIKFLKNIGGKGKDFFKGMMPDKPLGELIGGGFGKTDLDEKALAKGWKLGGEPRWEGMTSLDKMLNTRMESPSLYDYYELLQPRLQKGLRGRGEATSPAAPYKQRPSIRRRIR